MKRSTNGTGGTGGLRPYLSPLHVFALSVGSAIGWASLVVSHSTYLAQAGTLGSILGLVLGLAVFDPQNDKSFYEVFSRADGLMYGRKAELKSMGAVTRE
ncbi:MAG: hypothetical protein IJU41_07415 [Clostridia bacterium]|nr:hypothetical protein [Clostridia bacterium]